MIGGKNITKTLKLSPENQDTWFLSMALPLCPSQTFILHECLFTFLHLYLIRSHLEFARHELTFSSHWMTQKKNDLCFKIEKY